MRFRLGTNQSVSSTRHRSRVVSLPWFSFSTSLVERSFASPPRVRKRRGAPPAKRKLPLPAGVLDSPARTERSRGWQRTDVGRGDGADRQETEISGRPPCRPKCMARAAGREAGFAAAGSHGSRAACASQLGLAGLGLRPRPGPLLPLPPCGLRRAMFVAGNVTVTQRARPPDD